MFAPLFRAALILAAATSVAAVHARWAGLRWLPDPSVVAQEKQRKAQSAAVKNESERIRSAAAITVDQLRRFAEEGAFIVDARERKLFEAEHLAAPVIMNIAPEDLPAGLDRLRPDVATGTPIVLYCNSDHCDASEIVYAALEEAFGAGYTEMYVYVPGWEGIKAAGLPTKPGADEWLEAEEAPPTGESAEMHDGVIAGPADGSPEPEDE